VNPLQEPPHVAAFFRAIEERRKEAPLIGAVLGGKEVCQRLIEAMKDAKGVHVESLLSALGSLAGFSCQMSIRAENPAAGDSVFVVVGGADGRNYFFGDRLNQPLAESQYSVWGLTAGKAQGLGCVELPDFNEIFGYVASTVGGDRFGMPRIPEGHRPSDLPLNYLKAIWPGIMPVASRFCARPSEWPILFGIAIQEVMMMGKGVVDPKLATIIVMECAVPMSKIDPELVLGS
jgi:hypothetical protein